MNTRIFRRALFVTGLLVAGLVAAPAAFAHSHVSIGIGFSGPGYSVGVGDCINCYGYRGYRGYRGYYAPVYYPRVAYYPTYYTPYPPAYYAPAPVYYRSYPVYGTVYYGSGYYAPHRVWHGHASYYYHH